jgi:hypothetical protein
MTFPLAPRPAGKAQRRSAAESMPPPASPPKLSPVLCASVLVLSSSGQRITAKTALFCPMTGGAYLPLRKLVAHKDRTSKVVIMLAAPLREDSPGSGVYVRLPTVVLKMLRRSPGGDAAALNEVALMMRASSHPSPHVASLLDAFQVRIHTQGHNLGANPIPCRGPNPSLHSPGADPYRRSIALHRTTTLCTS